MANLPKFTLGYDEKKDVWTLRNDRSGRLVKSFDTKGEATTARSLEKAIGGEGSVKIQAKNGKLQQERTFPRSRDPRKSKG